MPRTRRTRLRKLVELVAEAHPELEDADTAIAGGMISVDGRVVTNPASLVRTGAAIAVRPDASLRGEAKLRAALDAFAVPVSGRVALDLGAAAGGFTRALLAAGAARVYAVDVGHGQLLGSLRQDARVVNLERTNVSALTERLVPDEVEVVTADLSYVSLATAIPQLEGRVALAADADLVALVKPQFELGLPEPPTDADALARAARAAEAGIGASGWAVVETIESPVRGTRGSVEFLLHARRAARAFRAPSGGKHVRSDEGGAMEVKLTEVQKHLKGVSYPASKDDLVSAAERNGADDDVVEVLRDADSERFDGPDDVMQALKGRLKGSD